MPAEKDIGGQARRVSVSVPAVDTSVVQEAATATENERNMSLWQSLKLYRKACMWSAFLSTCIVMEGFDLVLLNNLYAYKPFRRDFGDLQPDGSYQLTATWQSALSNGNLCGQFIGLFISGIVADRIGYRRTIIGALTLCSAFIFIIFFASSLTQLLVGEILVGIPWGTFQALSTTYASEVCPIHLRAYLATYINLCWVLGQFIASGVLRAMVSTHNDKWGYKIPFALQWMWPIPLSIGIFLAPESPWWLVRHEKIEEAKQSLLRLTSRNAQDKFDVDATISMIQHTNELEKEASSGTSYFDLFRGTNLRRTEIATVCWVIQAFSGSALIGYSTYFYQNAGMDDANSFSMSLGQYAIGAVGTILSWFAMGWFGRRTLYLYGLVAMFVMLFSIGCASFAGKDNSAAQWAIGSLLLVYTFIYDTTVGPVCYSLVAELTSTRMRTKSIVFARNAYNVASIVNYILSPRMMNPSAWNWGAKVGFFWAGSCVICATWTYFRLPEPKGRTYGELDILFEQRISARKFSSTIVEPLDAAADVRSVSEEKGVNAEQVERIESKRHT